MAYWRQFICYTGFPLSSALYSTFDPEGYRLHVAYQVFYSFFKANLGYVIVACVDEVCIVENDLLFGEMSDLCV